MSGNNGVKPGGDEVMHKQAPIWVVVVAAALGIAGGGAGGTALGGREAQEMGRLVEKMDKLLGQVGDLRVQVAANNSLGKRLDQLEERVNEHQKDGHPGVVIQMIESLRKEHERRLEKLEDGR